MAEVLSPLSSPNDPASYIHARPSSSDKYQTAMSSSQQQQQQQQQQHQQQQPRFNTLPRSQYPPQQSPTGYRGGASSAPIAPYAFKTTPQLRNDSRTDVNTRKSSAPSTLPPLQPLSSENPSAANRQRYPAPSSISTTSSGSSSNPPSIPPFSKDDSSLFTSFTVPDFSITSDVNGASSPIAPDKDANPSLLVDPSKPSPERYRRGHRRAETNVPTQPPQVYQPPGNINVSNGFDTGKMGQFFYNPQKSVSPQRKPVPPPPTEAKPTESALPNEEGAMKNVPLSIEKPDLPKRYRKRTGTGGSVDTQTPPDSPSAPVASPKEPASPVQVNSRQEIRPSSSGSAHRHSSSSSRNEPQGTRSFTSADAVRRMQNPSPLSKPPSSGDPASTSDPSGAGASTSPRPSPAVAAMAALNAGEKDSGKGVKSRIRRAFSFGSAQELKRASGGSGSATNDADPAADKAKARQEQFSNELDEEQDAIAKQQEAAGLGNSIYSGQGNVFTGSTDNLSISSTASSASLMLRKMGKGMKKGGRSIKGLFRPKSVIGVPAADGPSEPSVGQVTMVTVEAEREKVNVNVDPHAQPGGGTGFPKLERNSMDAGRANLSTDLTNNDPNDTGSKDSRRSIIGGDQDRQEVLAAVKRGILKRTGTSSPVTSPLSHPGEGDSPSPTVFAGAGIERKGSPAPSTTSSEPRRNGHRRTDSHTLEGDDYFARGGQGNQSSKSLPGTPRGGARNISFSPRIQFYDVWSSSEYDRRGDIATCNRLTPMLAQQIKEELNNFKMEMEVHELSKPHTHFF